MSAGEGSSVVEAPAADSKRGDASPKDTQVTTLKRKAAPDSPTFVEDLSPKRVRIEEDEDDKGFTPKGTVDTTEKAKNGAHPPTSDARNRDDRQTERRHSATRKEDADSPIQSPTEVRRPSLSGPDRRRGFSQEEKTRGKRLFGGLLSTLSQTTASSQQRKRLEIERRQQDRAQQQQIDDDKRRAEKLARLETVRKIEQVKFDEQVMQTRHSNMLATARSLQTRTQPKLYYRPWQLSQSQEETIKDQIREAEELIHKERQDFKRRKEQRLKELGVPVPPSAPDSAASEPGRERSNHYLSPDDATNDTSPAVDKAAHERERDHDETGDVMVEAEEDTVIY